MREKAIEAQREWIEANNRMSQSSRQTAIEEVALREENKKLKKELVRTHNELIELRAKLPTILGNAMAQLVECNECGVYARREEMKHNLCPHCH